MRMNTDREQRRAADKAVSMELPCDDGPGLAAATTSSILMHPYSGDKPPYEANLCTIISCRQCQHRKDGEGLTIVTCAPQTFPKKIMTTIIKSTISMGRTINMPQPSLTPVHTPGSRYPCWD